MHPSIWLTAAALLLTAANASAQPTFGNPSPTAGGTTSQKANAAADVAAYKPVEYVNKGKKGPALVVIPGEVKSNNASFVQKFGPNNIADLWRDDFVSVLIGCSFSFEAAVVDAGIQLRQVRQGLQENNYPSAIQGFEGLAALATSWKHCKSRSVCAVMGTDICCQQPSVPSKS